MNRKRSLAMLGAILALTTVCAYAAGQGGGSQLNGQDTEFGSIRMPMARESAGEAVDVEAHVVLKTHYAEKDARFFLFAFKTDTSSVRVAFDNVYASDGTPLRFYKDERGLNPMQPQVIIDLKDLPPEGEEIIMHAVAEPKTNGQFQVGALVIAFDYQWNKMRMSNNLDAQLYGYTTVAATGVQGGGVFQGPFEGKGNVPGLGLAGALGAVAVVALAVAGRRRL